MCCSARWLALVSEDDVTVYAYKMRHQGRFWTRSMADPWYDLTANTEDELHAFAAQLGIPRQGFQPGPLVGVQQVSVSWHYTVTAGERDRAVAPGAHAITPAEVAKIEQQRAAMLGVIYRTWASAEVLRHRAHARPPSVRSRLRL